MDNESRSYHGNNAILKAEAERGDEIYSHYAKRVYELQDYAGFKVMFGEDEPVILEPESDEPFAIVKDRIKCFDEPQTQTQLHHLEKFGWYYK